MAEKIDFAFDGQLSSEHLMDFYESGRFQYGAARLLVKLDQFRRTGKFAQKITYQNNTRMLLTAQKEGSFVIETIAPFLPAVAETFLTTPISLLLSYVSERVFKSTDNIDVRLAFETRQKLIDLHGKIIEAGQDITNNSLGILSTELAEGRKLTEQNTALYERLLAEQGRRAYLEGAMDQLGAITPEQESKLITMASPLLKDMGVALRSSANNLTISAGQDGKMKPLVFVNRNMASAIETEVIDKESTIILVKIVQYNRETGWGKLRLKGMQIAMSFNIPADKKPKIQPSLIKEMNEDQTYIECKFVRSSEGVRNRAILISIVDIEKLEGGIVVQ